MIAASHRNLREMIANGTFREDLYYRLNGITLELPALRDRADKERVIHHALAAETGNGRPAAIEMDALQRLVAYPWPGNIRELRNVIRTALAICEGGVVRGIDLPREIRESESNIGQPMLPRWRLRPRSRRCACESVEGGRAGCPGAGHRGMSRKHDARGGPTRDESQHPVPQNEASRHSAGPRRLTLARRSDWPRARLLWPGLCTETRCAKVTSRSSAVVARKDRPRAAEPEE